MRISIILIHNILLLKYLLFVLILFYFSFLFLFLFPFFSFFPPFFRRHSPSCSLHVRQLSPRIQARDFSPDRSPSPCAQQPQLLPPRSYLSRKSAARKSQARDPSPRDFSPQSQPGRISGHILSQLQPRQSVSSSWITASLHSDYQPDSMIFLGRNSLFKCGD